MYPTKLQEHNYTLPARQLVRKLRDSINLLRVSYSPFFRRFPCERASLLVDSRALVSTEHKFIYFRVPKAANSSIVASLLAEDHEFHRDAVEGLKKSGPRLSLLTKAEVHTILSEYRLFVFVRNPFARVYSCYLDKIARPSPQAKEVTKFLNKKVEETPSFDEFLDYLESDQNMYLDGHWARQSDLIPVPFECLDIIGSVEELERDFSKLIKVLNYSSGAVRRFAPHATGADMRLYELTVKQVERIVFLYEADFDNFGYSKNLDPSNLVRRK